MLKKIIKFFSILLYYGFAIHLPCSYQPYSFKIFKFLRYILAKNILKSCGKNVNIENGARFGFNVTLGNNSGLGVNSIVERAIIGNNVMMGRDVIIISGSHKFENCNIPMIFQGMQPEKEVIIEDDVWIGHRVIILPGVKIGRGSIIGAGAVVTKDVTQNTIVGGVPAKIIRYRK